MFINSEQNKLLVTSVYFSHIQSHNENLSSAAEETRESQGPTQQPSYGFLDNSNKPSLCHRYQVLETTV